MMVEASRWGCSWSARPHQETPLAARVMQSGSSGAYMGLSYTRSRGAISVNVGVNAQYRNDGERW